jgi:hypothetical protein
MRDILLLALFFIAAGAAAAAIVVGWWITAGTYSRMDPRDSSSWGPILFGRYRRHFVVVLVLMAVTLTVFIVAAIVSKHVQ